MFRWFATPKKKDEDDEFVLLDVPTNTLPSSDVTPDIVSDVTSAAEYTSTYYSFDNHLCEDYSFEDRYDLSRIEAIDDTTSESSESQEEVEEEEREEEEEEDSEYNYDDIEDITAEINAMDAESFYRQVEWKNWNQQNIEAIVTPDFQIIPNPEEDVIEKGIRTMIEYFFSVDVLFEELLIDRLL
jgi:hypothetical protein